jgi:hypothetical protein
MSEQQEWPVRREWKDLQKPVKGSALLERREKRAKVQSNEKDEKAKVVFRDGVHTCRLVPNCREREKHETAHLDAKGIGGDHGIRTIAERMIRSCFWHHQGKWSLHSQDLRVECLTDKGTNGPIEVWGKDEDGRWYSVGRESAVGIWERD